MKRQLTEPILLIAIVASLLVVPRVTAQNVSEAERQFREAQHKQLVEGDLNGAVKMYQRLIAANTTDRVVKAKALLQLAGAQEALGKESEARSLYEQIVREFRDQPAAAETQKWFDAHRTVAPPTMTLRKIEFGDDVQDVVATDGQKAVYWNANHTTLYFGDIKGKDKRIVFEPKETVPDVFASRDLSMVFLFFPGGGYTTRTGYAVVKTDGTGYRDLMLTLDGTRMQFATVKLSWSWDNRYLTIYASGRYLYKVSLENGQVLDLLGKRQVKGPIVSQFSPDGRFIAYSEAGAIYAISAQGGAPWLIARNAALGDWTPDGGYLMIEDVPAAPVINGSRKIWAMPMQNGRTSGERVAIASSLGLPESHPKGTMIVATGGRFEGSQVYLGTLDSRDHLGPWKILDLTDATGLPQPAWSPDGRQIAYTAGLNSMAVRVRDLESGEDREVYRGNAQMQNCFWASTRPQLLCGQIGLLNDGVQRFEILSIPLDPGRAQKIGSFEGYARFLHRLSKDDRILETGGYAVSHQWEIGTDPASEKLVPRYQSDDGRWVLDLSVADGRRKIMIRPSSGDNEDLRLLVQTTMRAVDPGLGPITVQFTPDSKWIVYHDKDANGKHGLYRVSVSGGSPPERLGDYPTTWEDVEWFSMSPDGRQFLAQILIPPKPPEFWVLENVLPTATAVPKSAPKVPAR